MKLKKYFLASFLAFGGNVFAMNHRIEFDPLELTGKSLRGAYQYRVGAASHLGVTGSVGVSEKSFKDVNRYSYAAVYTKDLEKDRIGNNYFYSVVSGYAYENIDTKFFDKRFIRHAASTTLSVVGGKSWNWDGLSIRASGGLAMGKFEDLSEENTVKLDGYRAIPVAKLTLATSI